MTVEIPGYKSVSLSNVVMDFNGTIAVDGKLKATVKPLLVALAKHLNVYVATSDTQGTAATEMKDMPVSLLIFNAIQAGESKKTLVEELGADHCACIGNGRNDRLMFQVAALSIAVLEAEGLYAPLLLDADLLARSSEEAIALLLDRKRLISGLRG
ncbi:MAG: ATPase P [Fretibacterium sp.]|nr:ATPase P [Fretibacterium sp.]